MICASDAPTSDSLKSGNVEDDSNDWVSSKLGCAVLSCEAFLLLSVLFLLQVAFISKSNGAKFPAEELPHIQEALTEQQLTKSREKINPN